MNENVIYLNSDCFREELGFSLSVDVMNFTLTNPDIESSHIHPLSQNGCLFFVETFDRSIIILFFCAWITNDWCPSIGRTQFIFSMTLFIYSLLIDFLYRLIELLSCLLTFFFYIIFPLWLKYLTEVKKKIIDKWKSR